MMTEDKMEKKTMGISQRLGQIMTRMRSSTLLPAIYIHIEIAPLTYKWCAHLIGGMRPSQTLTHSHTLSTNKRLTRGLKRIKGGKLEEKHPHKTTTKKLLDVLQIT